MKKKLFQRFGALALSAMMACSLMATPAFAALGETATTTLTINNAIDGTKYKIYKILDLTYTAGAENQRATYAYSYNQSLEDILKSIVDNGGYGRSVDANGAYEVVLDENGDYVSGMRGYDKNGDQSAAYFTLNDGSLVFQLMVKDGTAYRLAKNEEYDAWVKGNFGQRFAAGFGEALKDKMSDPAQYTLATTLPEADDTPYSAKLANGYYLIESGANRKVMTFSLPGTGAMVINEKNSKPTLDKKVLLDNGDNQYGDENDKGVGDLVKYRVEIDTGAGVTGLKFTDTLSDGLTFVSLDSIHFFGRNADGKVSSSNDAAVNEANAENGIKAPVWDLDKPVTADTGLVVDGNRAFYPTSNKTETGSVKGGWLEDTPGTIIDGTTDASKEFHNWNLDASYENNVITVEFSKQWLMSKRAEPANTPATAENRHLFDKDPMQPNDGRLKDSDKDSAALFNPYVGDTTTPVDDGGIIVIYYTAKINDNAKVNGSGNPNSAHLDYSNDPDIDPDNPEWEESNDDHTTTYVYEMDLLKHATGDEKIKLQGAKFEVRRAGYGAVNNWLTVTDASNVTVPADFAGRFKTDGQLNDPITFVQETVDGKTVYRVATDEEKKAEGFVPVKELETDANGQINVTGLDSDLYQLKETVAPDGYVKMDDDTYVYVVIGSVESIGTVDRDENQKTVTAKAYVQKGEQASNQFVQKNPTGMAVYAFGVENASGMQMPETGGIGTTIFYAIGGLLVVGAGVLLVVKKRTGGEE